MSKKDCNCDHHKQSHGNGFTLGMVIGGALVFLTTTEKGRRILKELSEKGLQAASNIKDLKNLDSLEKVQEEMVESTPMSTPEPTVPEKAEPRPSRVRKFFRGVKKK